MYAKHLKGPKCHQNLEGVKSVPHPEDDFGNNGLRPPQAESEGNMRWGSAQGKLQGRAPIRGGFMEQKQKACGF